MKLAQLIAQKEAITAAKAEVDQKYYERNNFELSIKELIRQEERRIREEKRAQEEILDNQQSLANRELSQQKRILESYLEQYVEEHPHPVFKVGDKYNKQGTAYVLKSIEGALDKQNKVQLTFYFQKYRGKQTFSLSEAEATKHLEPITAGIGSLPLSTEIVAHKLIKEVDNNYYYLVETIKGVKVILSTWSSVPFEDKKVFLSTVSSKWNQGQKELKWRQYSRRFYTRGCTVHSIFTDDQLTKKEILMLAL